VEFVCKYGTPDGRVLSEVQRGADVFSVRRELERQGCYVFEVKPRGGIDLRSLWPGRRTRKMKMEAFLAFNQEMAALLRAGLPLLQTLELMLERMEDPGMRAVLGEIRDQVRSGAELSDAFASFGDLFPPLYSSSLKAGERSGELEQVIRRFVRYLRLLLNARKRVVSALVYPGVLISLSILMVGIMTIYVVPTFSKFYDDLDAELPGITKVTLAISFWLRDNIFLLAGGLVVGVVLLRRWMATPAGRDTFDRLRLKLPIVGQIFHLFSISEFCRSLATLLAGGIPLVTAAETAVKAVGNKYMARKIEPAIDDVRQGMAFYAALEKTTVFTHMSIDMIKVGEATGALDEMLNSVSDYVDEIVETKVQRLLTLIEPVLLVIMGIIVGVILISIYLPMFSAFSQIGR
jgi:type IV pilus assembly protein PilC